MMEPSKCSNLKSKIERVNEEYIVQFAVNLQSGMFHLSLDCNLIGANFKSLFPIRLTWMVMRSVGKVTSDSYVKCFSYLTPRVIYL